MAIKNTQVEPKKNKSKQYINAIFAVVAFLGLILLLSFGSFYFNGFEDQSQISNMADRDVVAQNIFGKFGALLGEIFIHYGIGIAAFFLPFFLFILSAKIITGKKIFKPFSFLSKIIFFLIWIPIFVGFIYPDHPQFSGVMGFEVNDFLNSFIGKIGVGVLLLVSLIIYLTFRYNLTYETFLEWKEKRAEKIRLELEAEEQKRIDEEKILLEQRKKEEAEEAERKRLEDLEKRTKKEEDLINQFNIEAEQQQQIKELEEIALKEAELEAAAQVIEPQSPEDAFVLDIEEPEIVNITDAVEEEIESIENNDFTFEIPKEEEMVEIEPISTDGLELKIERIPEEETVEETAARLVAKQGKYDQRQELPNYQFPHLNLLKKYESGANATIDQKELEQNKNRILETLRNYGIEIQSITATIGPTVTLYEIVPKAGVRISKIKNLEDDIALSLAALGIRIIAPIPGKGTIGIEVPNSNPSMVSMQSVLASAKFQNADMELPIAFGKTITNETFVADLAKMPHLLMAGATGQGKSVGLNAIITSLIYKKHPSELKFVMVDPKKVELTLYSKIERHFLAKLPDAEEAIITDNAKVINTLNSLCIEMDERYELLKNAYVRNIKEYNVKFKERKLNPENGHKFLPYIVLIVDEFADLIMTAGKEVELPIARLAQLARAVGIHLIIATQRPSVNVITGTIKANFPGRVAFRVTSKIDSRTILDSPGADQLIGKGDMLFTTGNELVRLQCAFVDTPEVDDITEFIGEQRGYPDAMHLPEYVGENESSPLSIDLSDRDVLFNDAARLIVIAQQGSASLLQRKLKLGYNRAGRLIDQLEAAGIVGPFEGSKARQVLVTDEVSLEQLLNNLN
ncbi:DNA translocase FtsK 4TM domain-containing protein [Faecalibacter macacae]|uniref:DNA translocase FtsK n=1 Tax=Faecalibacter macacae TaxID=1859289 RepID=A0A3L9MG35_9FLAO|nr:DNA translocase FtsK 4TM domain-containing protein [Faecalibacter macacae]RLZ11903.1 DNA translocase FtsK [Faecalibacter macacae]